MADLIETINYEPGIYQLERTDLVDAGVNGNGVANRQAKQLANRTAWLRQKVNDLENRVVVLEDIKKISLSKVATITAGDRALPLGSSLSGIAISTRSLPFNTYFSPVSYNDVKYFYEALDYLYPSIAPPFFPLWAGSHTEYLDWFFANFSAPLQPVSQGVYESYTVMALMDLGPEVSSMAWRERAAELANVPVSVYEFQSLESNRDFLRLLS